MAALLTVWRRRRAQRQPGNIWIRNLRPTWSDLDSNIQLVITLSQYDDQPAIVQFSSDSAVVVIWFCKYENGRIVSGQPRAWDSTGRIVPVPRDTQELREEGRSPDGRLVATFGGPDGGWDFPVRVTELENSSDVRDYRTDLDTHISAVAISRNSQLLAAVGYGLEGGVAYVWDLAGGEVIARPNADEMSHAVCFSADETKLAFASGSSQYVCVSPMGKVSIVVPRCRKLRRPSAVSSSSFSATTVSLG
jgi:hypothetical protein